MIDDDQYYADQLYYEEMEREEERARQRRADDAARRALLDAETFAKSCAVDRIEETLSQNRYRSMESSTLRRLADEVDFDCGDWETAQEIRRIEQRRRWA